MTGKILIRSLGVVLAFGLFGCAAPEGATSTSAAVAPCHVDEFTTLALEKDPASAARLTQGLVDADPVIRRLAIYGLQRLGDPSIGGAIALMLNDSDPWVVRTAATALGELRCTDQAGTLTALLEDESLTVRLDAFVALARIGRPDTAGAILEALADRRLWTSLNVWDQMALLHVVERPWFSHPDAEGFLLSMLEYGSWEHPEYAESEPSHRERFLMLIPARASVILAERFGNPAGEDYLLDLLARGDHDAQDAARALGAIKSKRAVPALVAMLESEWFVNRRYALEALGAIGDDSVLPAIRRVLDSDASPRLRRAAADACQAISGERPEADPAAVAATVAQADGVEFNLPGGRRPPLFICLGVDDCVNIEGLEAMLDIVETLAAHDRKVAFTMWVAPLAGDYENRDLLKETILLQRLFDLGCEIAHHTLHHNPGGHAWRSLPREVQVEEIEGCTQWYRDNIAGFTRPFSHKGGGGGVGGYLDRTFTRELLTRQNFLYGGDRRGRPHASQWTWPSAEAYTRIPISPLDASAPPVGAELTDGIVSDYPGMFDYELADGTAMMMANLDYRYRLPQRTPVCVNAFHDWGFKTLDDSICKYSHRNQAAILKQFLIETLVERRQQYPDVYCVTYRQLLEYIRTGDLERTLAIGNGQDSRNPLIAAEGE